MPKVYGVSIGAALAGVGVGGSKILEFVGDQARTGKGHGGKIYGRLMLPLRDSGSTCSFSWVLAPRNSRLPRSSLVSVALVTLSTLLFFRLFSHQRAQQSGL